MTTTVNVAALEQKIRAISKVMIWLSSLGAIALVAAFIYVGMNDDILTSFLKKSATSGSSVYVLTPITRTLSLVVAALPMAGLLYVLFQVRCLFTGYLSNDVFSSSAAHRLENIGIMILCLVPLRIVSNSLIVLLATFHNPPGQHQFSVSFGSPEFLLLIFGGMIMAIGWVMHQAALMAEDYRQII